MLSLSCIKPYPFLWHCSLFTCSFVFQIGLILFWKKSLFKVYLLFIWIIYMIQISIYMDVLSTCMLVHHLHGWCLRRPTEAVGSSRTGVEVGWLGTIIWVLGFELWVLLGPLEEQLMSLTAGPSLQPLHFYFWLFYKQVFQWHPLFIELSFLFVVCFWCKFCDSVSYSQDWLSTCI